MYLDMIVKLMVKHMYNKENKRRREPWEMSFLKVKEKKYGVRTYKKIYERTSICKIEDATHRVLNFVCCVLRTTYFFDCLCVCSSLFSKFII